MGEYYLEIILCGILWCSSAKCRELIAFTCSDMVSLSDLRSCLAVIVITYLQNILVRLKLCSRSSLMTPAFLSKIIITNSSIIITTFTGSLFQTDRCVYKTHLIRVYFKCFTLKLSFDCIQTLLLNVQVKCLNPLTSFLSRLLSVLSRSKTFMKEEYIDIL